MYYNPLNSEYKEKQKEYDELQDKIKHKNEKLLWYEITQLEDLNMRLENLKSFRTFKIREKTNQKDECEKLEKDGHFRLFNLKVGNPITAIKQGKIKRNIVKIEDKLIIITSNIEDVKCEIKEFSEFDEKSTRVNLDMLIDNLAFKKRNLSKLLKRKGEIDHKLMPVIREINELEEKYNDSVRKLEMASSFDDKLSNESNPFYRKNIHEECENELGDGQPYKIIKEERSKSKILKRKLDKIRKRAFELGRKYAREIDKVIIDGNNLCYEGGEFVGLKPLKKLVFKLVNDGYDLVIVFDSDIRSILSLATEEVRSQFPENVLLHIVATAEKADETILELADELNHYVISNDRYLEYSEKDPVKEMRIIRHEIVNNKILVHDLDINLNYRY